MPAVSLIYRDRIVRAVTGSSPAVANVVDTAALDRFCDSLVDAEEAKQLLCEMGYGMPAQSLVELVQTLTRLRS